ncbi:MAG: ankyrin repeat domain-containing protein [Candidatus Berkelbacteria bacterium]
MLLCDSYTNPKNPTLYGCACRRDVARAIEMIKAGTDLEASGESGLTALHYSAWKNLAELATELLNAGANINVPANCGTTPLHLAAFYGRLEMAKLLLDRGAVIDSKCENGATPLKLCCVTAYPEVLALLLERGANPNCVTTGGETILMEMCQAGQAANVRLLLDHQADPNVGRDGYGFTCLHWAAYYGYEKIARMLLKRGAARDVLSVNVPLGDGSVLIIPKGFRNLTPAQLASDKKHPRTAKLINSWS